MSGTDEARSENVVLELDEVFDVPAALRIKNAIANLPASAEVTLDCRRTRHFDGFAFAALMQVLLSTPLRSLSTLGLNQCHRRVLKYLGLGEGELGGVGHELA